MTPVVIDASAGVELVADTMRGRALRALLPADAVPWVPDAFFVECGAVLRRWDLNAILPPPQIAQAVKDLMAWPLRVVGIRGLFADAWRLRTSITFSDALYVVLAEHLGAALLTDDQSWPTRRTVGPGAAPSSPPLSRAGPRVPVRASQAGVPDGRRADTPTGQSDVGEVFASPPGRFRAWELKGEAMTRPALLGEPLERCG